VITSRKRNRTVSLADTVEDTTVFEHGGDNETEAGEEEEGGRK
jgi:hypothetical protein